MAQNSVSNSNVYRHDNYSTVAAASVATKTPINPIDYLLIINTDGSNDASVSFDGGATFITILHGNSLELFPSKMQSYKIKDAVDNSHATIQCLYGSEK